MAEVPGAAEVAGDHADWSELDAGGTAEVPGDTKEDAVKDGIPLPAVPVAVAADALSQMAEKADRGTRLDALDNIEAAVCPAEGSLGTSDMLR